ncbi:MULTISPECIES: T9SS type A sorting domain-containing protein [Niastella]|uniref:T9SS type A sorting domain-containing protein n=1 Tax=Niastella soli TaxID=2821487 RepID=A0ABS3YZ20_9BACT|nr:T9SS type A sorting domain-containing protein [Niastella soli]MBO9203079.1 T9SS type A sorting domain-containing protein [Niastella soli]
MKKHYIISFFLALLITSQVHSQNTLAVEWEYSFGGSGSDLGKKLLCTTQGDYVLLGDGVATHDGDLPPAIGGADIILTKFSKWGQKKWVKTFGSDDGLWWDKNSTMAGDFCQTIDGGFIIIGNEWSAMHGDSTVIIKTDSIGNQQWRKTYKDLYQPWAIRQKKNGTYVLGLLSGGDIVIAGLDIIGNLSWKDTLTGSKIEYGNDLELTQDGGFVLTGSTMSHDGDFSTSNGSDYYDAFIAKYTKDNQLQWVKCMGGAYHDILRTVQEDIDGSFWAGGEMQSDDAWLVKTDKDGNLLWQKTWAGNWTNIIRGLTLTADGNLAVCGSVLSTDGDFTANINGHRSWVAKINKATGQIMRQGWFGGRSYEDAPVDILEDPEGSLAIISSTWPNNPYVSSYKGGDNDMWIVKLRNAVNTIKATVYLDNNQNGQKDTGEPPFGDAYIKLKRNATDSALLSYNDGSFTANVDTGRYEISLTPFRPYYNITPATKQVYFSDYNKTDSVSFGVVPVPGIVDVTVSSWSTDPARLGRNANINVKYTNNGTAASNTVLKFVKDHRTDFIASPLIFTQDGDTLTANITNLKPQESREITITLAIKTPPAVNLNDTLLHEVSIGEAGTDSTPADNRQSVIQVIVGSYDPNDKREITLPGKMNARQLKDREYLVYQIRFQNVGNDTAFNIVVRDTIEEKLDINTFEMIKADHAYTMQITQGRYVEWRFDNILLADSNINEPRSHAYLIYRIKPKASLQMGDVVKNTASIYFDYNPPVNTNEERTLVVPNVPATPSINGIGVAFCAGQGVQKGKIANLPADGPGVTTTIVRLDNSNLTVAADSTFSFNVDLLQHGSHTIEVTFTNITGSQTVAYQFSVTAAQTPQVTITASSTYITNLTTPVTLTAASTGSGANPLYSFARDKAFTNVLQPEGPNAFLIIQPSALALGDNKIYVRVKTSASCYTIQTNFDSILLKRDASTGIVDVNDQGRVITVLPNPFSSTVTLVGLNNSKAYSIVLHNSHGQAVYTREVKNIQLFEIQTTHIAPGVYWLTLYNANKKPVGTEKVIKLR